MAARFHHSEQVPAAGRVVEELARAAAARYESLVRRAGLGPTAIWTKLLLHRRRADVVGHAADLCFKCRRR